MISKRFVYIFGFLFFAFTCVTPAFSQDDLDDGWDDDAVEDEEGPRFFVGANVGGYFANQSTAKYYNGDGTYTNGVAWIWQGVNVNGTTNVNYDRIRLALGDRDFELGQTPDSMRYNPALLTGLNVGYMFTAKSGVFLDVNIINLKLVDAVTLFVEDGNNQFSEPIIYQATINGEEKRLSVNLGYRQLFGEHPRAWPYLEIGGVFNSVRPSQNQVIIENLTYNILPAVNNGFNAPTRLGGTGFGAMLGGGLHYKMNPKFRFDIGLNLKYEKIALLPEAQREYNLQTVLFVRFLFL